MSPSTLTTCLAARLPVVDISRSKWPNFLLESLLQSNVRSTADLTKTWGTEEMVRPEELPDELDAAD
ncbi:unnamed protein product [Pleuronectes platessa]|uniref:Uncharacterized protein n=1 Tax=Pleuronectes platessa TaxID=8262 RepID=A0A9N7TSN4_PLEPL|nr:unnamed protein product [Pleuronectes platessa]